MTDDPTREATALLQDLIRNACVNDGRPESGEEVRSSDLLTGYLEGSGLDIEHYEPQPGRRSLLAKIEGSDPQAPSLLLMGHTDVVPVNVDGWSRDPFAAELVDGMVWGRGAVDMLNLTATMAVAFKRLAQSGFKPKGTISYLAVADEEARGIWGADWLVEHELDDVKADYVLTESGGFQVPDRTGPAAAGDGGGEGHVLVEDHGARHARSRVIAVPDRQRARHRGGGRAPACRVPGPARAQRYLAAVGAGSAAAGRVAGGRGISREDRRAPYRDGADRVLVHAHDVRADGHPRRHQDERDPRPGGHRGRHPDAAGSERRGRAQAADGGARRSRRKVEIESGDDPSSQSEIDTPLWDALGRVTERLCEGSALVPWLMTGATDNRFFRRAGSVGYGFGLFSKRLAFEDYATMFHGNDERVDQESLQLSTELWLAIAEELVGPHAG